jgi:chaperonin GroEL
VRRALSYPLKLIAKNAGVNGSVVTEKVLLIYPKVISYISVELTDMRILLHQVLSNDDFNFGYNAATGQYEDLMAVGIIDPTKVCGLVSLFLLALTVSL